jgi:hypothetical protein
LPKIFAMQRANGEFFAIAPNRIAVWAGPDNLARSRAHNPALDLFRPILVQGRIADKIRKITGGQHIWLVEPITSNADLREGRWIDWSELEKLQSQQPPEEPPTTNQPRVRATVQEFQFN